VQVAAEALDAASPPLAAGALRRVDRWIGHLLSGVCATLLVAEIVLLILGVVARYVFRAPQVWVDELTSLLFLWLAMLGAVLALRGGTHMRMAALIGRTRGSVRQALDTLQVAAPMLFLLCVLYPSMRYVQNEQIVSLSTMDLSLAWRAAAMPSGVLLMLVSVALRVRRPAPAELAGVVVLLVATGAMLLLAPTLHRIGNYNLLVFFLGVAAATVLSGIPIAFSFGLSTLGYLALSTRIPLSVLVARMDAGMSHPVLLSIPLFVFLGLLIEMTGMAAVIVGFLSNLLGHVRGGLSYVLIAAMYLVSGISGSKAADMAAIAPALFPEMVKRGIPRGELVALLAATGAQTETIPPSLILITIGSVTGISIAALFAGGLAPGIAGGLFLGVVVWWRARRGDNVAPRVGWRVVVRSLVIALPALALPFVIRAAIVEGVATATEVSTIGIVYACIAGLLVYRRFEWGRLWPMLVQTATLSGAILLIVGAATAMAWAITQSGVARGLGAWIIQLPGGASSFLAVSALIFIVLGSVLEGIPAIVLMGPLMFPIAHQLGLNEVHYAVVAVLSMGIGLFAPPFGVGYYVACAIGSCDPEAGLPYIGRYILALFVGLVVVAAVPWITTFVL
jgi:tripartite ATP-independent transporter DctM subunit